MVTDYYKDEFKDSTGLKIGDVITKIDSRTVEEIIKEKLPYYPASNYPTLFRDLAKDILRSPGRELELEYLSNGTKDNKTIALYDHSKLDMYGLYRKPDGPSYKFLEDNIGYITLARIKNEDVKLIKETFKNANGIIVDIRNYPSNFVVFSLGSFFISKPTASVKFTKSVMNNPGEFLMLEPLRVGKNNPKAFKGQVVVLINETNQSQAEYTAMALQAGNNTTVIGSTTAGADGDISSITLPGGLYISISGIGVYYPDGTETQRVGIVPDIEVKPTIEGVKNGKDEVLDKAIEIIKADHSK